MGYCWEGYGLAQSIARQDIKKITYIVNEHKETVNNCFETYGSTYSPNIIVETALSLAVKTGNLKIVKFLLDSGALFLGTEKFKPQGFRKWEGYVVTNIKSGPMPVMISPKTFVFKRAITKKIADLLIDEALIRLDNGKIKDDENLGDGDIKFWAEKLNHKKAMQRFGLAYREHYVNESLKPDPELKARNRREVLNARNSMERDFLYLHETIKRSPEAEKRGLYDYFEKSFGNSPNWRKFKSLFIPPKEKNQILGKKEIYDNLFKNKKRIKKADAYFRLARLYVKKSMFKKAKESYLKSIEFDKEAVGPYVNIANVYNELHEPYEAIDYAAKALELDPEDKQAFVATGNAWLVINEPEKAEEYYLKAVKIDPKYEAAYINLGVLYMNMGDCEKAEAMLKKALELNKNSEEALLNLGCVYSEMKRYEDAIWLFDCLKNINPKNADAYYFTGVLYNDKEDMDKAAQKYEKVLSIKPDYYDAMLNLAYIFIEQCREYGRAEKLLLAVIANDPSSIPAHGNLENLYGETGRYEEARKEEEIIKELEKAK